MNQYDIIILGSGPGGYIAAIRSAQLGFKTAIIEQENNLGGICLNWGCIPTKSLLRTSEIYRLIKRSSEFGIHIENVNFDIQSIITNSRNVVDKLSQGIAFLMHKNNITVYKGFGSITNNHTIQVINTNNTQNIIAERIILATGASIRNLSKIQIDGHLVWNAQHAMSLRKLPDSLLIIGAGAIGMEFASFYNAFDVQVTVVEIQDTILPTVDKDIAVLAQEIFIQQGITIYTNSSIKNLIKNKDSIQVLFSSGEIRVFDRALVAVGVQANTEHLGLENTDIQLSTSGFIKINDYCETHEPRIYAIGDVTGPPYLAHKASHEAIICVEKIAGKNTYTMKKECIPHCTYSYPQIASIGLTEEEARKKGFDIKVGKYFSYLHGKSIALNETDGLSKTIIDKNTGELLGAHMIGVEVTELISNLALIKQLEGTDYEIKSTIFPHPTIAEMIKESVLMANNESINS
ncbi:dihydrolipoyl dehydrogenase [Wolbachia endosymbiont of Howardula sp.]|uniref:dihydrolipoyl dehydrogenase n=1 Tax=Wolbachia endosymbiont of Howardula sp. TaxID=2916816 RepID=UPI00217D4F1E|nr:dihydrolipoyl dehydrogenase [Wolbachia endosymbiont of Howardula sp.]UWI83354.1 dihydrolipoyl dehydrogenase [Wolbachia endosymbiont of Howardula sp.]